MTDNGQQTTDIVTLTVPSHPRFLYVIRSALYPVVLDAGFSRKETRKIILAVDEACSNIIKYAYEGDHSKQIAVTIVLSSDNLVITLKDSGKQVDRSKIAPRDLADIRPGGLGTHFMNTVFDGVHYDTSGNAGTALTLRKKRPSRQENEVRA